MNIRQFWVKFIRDCKPNNAKCTVCLSVYRSFCHVLFWGRQVDSVTHDDVLCPFVRLAVLLSLLLQFRKGPTSFYVQPESNCFALQ